MQDIIKNQLDIVEKNLRYVLDNLSHPVDIEWKRLRPRDICEAFSRFVMAYVANKNKFYCLNQPEIKRFISDKDKNHSINVMVAAALIDKQKSFSKLKENLSSKEKKQEILAGSIFSPMSPENWYKDYVSELSHEGLEINPKVNKENYEKFLEFSRKFEKVSENFVKKYPSSPYSKIYDNYVKNFTDKVEETPVSQTLLAKKIGFDKEDIKYIAFLPEQMEEKYLDLFYRIPWFMVFDTGKDNSSNKLLKKGLETLGKNLHRVVGKGQIEERKIYTNWLFPYGDKEEISITEFGEYLSEWAKKVGDQTFYIFDFLHDKSKTRSLLKQFIQAFYKGKIKRKTAVSATDTRTGYFNERSRLFSLNNSESNGINLKKLKNYLEEPNEEDSYQQFDPDKINVIEFSGEQLLKVAEDLKKLPEKLTEEGHIESFSFLTPEYRQECNKVGIRFLEDLMTAPLESGNNFYTGHPISYSELQERKDVIREERGYNKLKDKIFEQLGDTEKIFKVGHQPGAGGTTFTRRLAYDLMYDKEYNFHIPVLFLDDKANSETALRINQISEEVGNRPVLVISEDLFQEGEFRTFRETNINHFNTRKINFLRLYHTNSPEENNGEKYDFYLKSRLSETEKFEFLNKYKAHFLQRERDGFNIRNFEKIYKDLKNQENLEVINFPYSFTDEFVWKDSEKVKNLIPKRGQYVKNIFDSLSPALQNFARLVAFIYRYSNQGVRASDLYKAWKGEFDSIQDIDAQDRENLQKILIEVEENKTEEKKWKPRFSPFAAEILQAYQLHYEGNLRELAEDLLNHLPNEGELPNYNLKPILDTIFVQQAKNSFKNHSEKADNIKSLQDRFSLLIGTTLANHGLLEAEEIFKKLIDKYPGEAHYYAHYGRLLFEVAVKENLPKDAEAFKEAEDLLETSSQLAKENKKDDDVLYHIYGMLHSRILEAIGKRIEDATEEEVKIHVMRGKEYFEKASEKKPLNHYSYLSLAILYREGIKIGTAIRNKDSFYEQNKWEKYKETAFEKDSTYLTYFQGLLDCIDELQVLMLPNEKLNSGFYRIQNFYDRLVGSSDSAIKNLDSLYKNANNDSEKIFFGYNLVNALLNHEKNRLSRSSSEKIEDITQVYKKLSKKNFDRITEELTRLKNLGDLRVYQKLFQINRYWGGHRYLVDDSISLLISWRHEAMNQSQNNPQAKWHVLFSNYYLGIAYALKLIYSDKEKDELLQREVEKCKEQTRKTASDLERSIYSRLAILEYDPQEDINWECVLTRQEAYDDPDTKKIPKKDRNLYIESVLKDVKESNSKNVTGILEPIGALEGVTFGAKNGEVTKKDNGNVVMKGVINFTFNGPSMYNQIKIFRNFSTETETEEKSLFLPEDKSIAPVSSNENVSDVKLGKESDNQLESPEKPNYQTEPELFISQQEIKAPELKVLKNIDLKEEKNRGWKSRRSGYLNLIDGKIYEGIVVVKKNFRGLKQFYVELEESGRKDTFEIIDSKIDSSFENVPVLFKMNSEPDIRKPDSYYWFASDIEKIIDIT